MVEKEQGRLLETEMNFSKVKHVDLRFQWPKNLRSNVDRLVHHTSVKLLPNSTLSFDHWKLLRYEASLQRESRRIWYLGSFFRNSLPSLRLFEEDWQIMKHFGTTIIPTLTTDIDIGHTIHRTYTSPFELLYDFSTFHSRTCECCVCSFYNTFIKQPTEQVTADTPLIQTVDF